MDKAILIPLILWAVLTVVTVLKSPVSSTARILAAISFTVYGFIFKDDIIAFIHLKEIPYMILIKNALEYVFISLAVLWPATLLYTQYMTEADSTQAIIRLAIFSAVACAGFLYFS